MARVLGLGTILKMDDDDSGGTYTSLVQLITATRPARVRERVEKAALEDTLACDDMGIEVAGDVVFEIYSDPGSSQETTLGTLFAAKTQILWQFLYADNGTETLEAVVAAIEPLPIVRGEHQKVRITLARQTASTFA
jgi:hypothetical protein